VLERHVPKEGFKKKITCFVRITTESDRHEKGKKNINLKNTTRNLFRGMEDSYSVAEFGGGSYLNPIGCCGRQAGGEKSRGG